MISGNPSLAGASIHGRAWVAPGWRLTRHFCVCVSFFFFFFFGSFRAAPVAYGSSQARGQLELQLQAYTTATAMPDPSRVCDLHHSSWCRILNPLNEARYWPRVLRGTSQIHYHWATMATPHQAFFFFGYTQGIWKFLGQRSNPSHCCDLCSSCGNAGSLTYCTIVRTPPPGIFG